MMGLTFIEVGISNPAHPKKQVKETFLIDSGAIYTIAPKVLLRRLGIKPHSIKVFTLADGTQVKRRVGDAVFNIWGPVRCGCSSDAPRPRGSPRPSLMAAFTINGQRGASPVIFGEKGDSQLFGVVSLGALGLMLDPIKRELRPLPMILKTIFPLSIESTHAAYS